MKQKQILFILGMGHSGTSVLGHCLNAHPNMFHVGEFIAPINRGKPVECMVCGSNCAVLGGANLSRRIESNVRFFLRVQKIYSVLCRVANIRLPFVGNELDKMYSFYFNAFRDKTILVDSSKSVNWMKYVCNNTSYKTKVVCIWRDVRALVWNRVKHGQDIDAVINNIKMAKLALEREVGYMSDDDVMHAKYEDMFQDTDEFFGKLCDFISVDRMLNMSEFYKVIPHVFGGNIGPLMQVCKYHGVDPEGMLRRNNVNDIYTRSKYYSNAEFKMDLRWESDLSDIDKIKIEKAFGVL